MSYIVVKVSPYGDEYPDWGNIFKSEYEAYAYAATLGVPIEDYSGDEWYVKISDYEYYKD
jgi:hypothetical protein